MEMTQKSFNKLNLYFFVEGIRVVLITTEGLKIMPYVYDL
jgi:hypothetical protein